MYSFNKHRKLTNASHCSKHYLILLRTLKVGFITPNLQVTRLKLQGIKSVFQGHTAKVTNLSLNPGLCCTPSLRHLFIQLEEREVKSKYHAVSAVGIQASIGQLANSEGSGLYAAGRWPQTQACPADPLLPRHG